MLGYASKLLAMTALSVLHPALGPCSVAASSIIPHGILIFVGVSISSLDPILISVHRWRRAPVIIPIPMPHPVRRRAHLGLGRAYNLCIFFRIAVVIPTPELVSCNFLLRP